MDSVRDDEGTTIVSPIERAESVAADQKTAQAPGVERPAVVLADNELVAPTPGVRHRLLAPTSLVRQPAWWGLVLVTTVWVSWLYLQVWRRHDRFGTFDNDLGFHSQYLWQIGRGRWFSTILGLEAFAHNATFGYLLLAPLSRFGAGPHVWNFIQTAAIASGAFAVFAIARRRLASVGLGAAVGVVWLLQPVVQGNVWETFHPEAMAMAPLLFAYNAADQRKWRSFAAWAALAIVWKADVALLLMVMGFVLLWKQRRSIRVRGTDAAGARTRGLRLRDARPGLVTIGLAGAWFFGVVSFMIPALSGGGTVFGGIYGELGDSPGEVVLTGLRKPGLVKDRLETNRPVRYGRDLLTPLAMTPLAGPEGLVIALPQMAVSLLSEREFTRDPYANPHYQALTVTALMIGSLEGLTRLRRRRPTAVIPVISVMAAFALATTASWGAMPSGVRRNTFWVPPGDPSKTAKREAIAQIGPDASVSATYLFVPHLAERETVYSFPNPWRQVFYGVEGTPRPDPQQVEFLLVDFQILSGGPDRELYDCLMGIGSFREVSRGADGQVMLHERVTPTDDEHRDQFRAAEERCARPEG
jgi:uncharacterized membrane protein